MWAQTSLIPVSLLWSIFRETQGSVLESFFWGGVFFTYSARQPLCPLSDITARGHKLQGQMSSISQAPRCFIYPVGPVTLPSLTQADCSAPAAVARRQPPPSLLSYLAVLDFSGRACAAVSPCRCSSRQAESGSFSNSLNTCTSQSARHQNTLIGPSWLLLIGLRILEHLWVGLSV